MLRRYDNTKFNSPVGNSDSLFAVLVKIEKQNLRFPPLTPLTIDNFWYDCTRPFMLRQRLNEHKLTIVSDKLPLEIGSFSSFD